MKLLASKKGFSIWELLVAAGLVSIPALLGGVLLRDFLATARTARVQMEANLDVLQLLKGINRDFQNSQEPRRACLLEAAPGTETNPNPDISDFSCFTENDRRNFSKTQGIGFGIIGNSPEVAYINTCQAYAPSDLPSGRDGRLIPPAYPSQLPWGGARRICPDPCPDGYRPVIKFLKGTGGAVAGKQLPKSSINGQNLEIWGAIICGSEVDDIRELQNLKSSHLMARNIILSAYVARGRFDIKTPAADPSGPGAIKQSYIWLTGGIFLDFLDSQEVSTFRCLPNDPRCN